MVVELEWPAALVVVDLQTGILANAFAHSTDDIVRATGSLIDAFRTRGGPIVFATSTGTSPGRNAYGSPQRVLPDEARVLAAGLEVREDDVFVDRTGLSVFTPELSDLLCKRVVSTVVLVGVATSFGVESSVRAAYDLGFHVIVAADAVTDLRAETYEHALQVVFPALAQVSSSEELIELLQNS